MHTYNGVLTILGLACFLYFVFCVSVKVKLTVPLLCVCVHFAWKGCPQNDLYWVGWDVKPYSLTHALMKDATLLDTWRCRQMTRLASEHVNSSLFMSMLSAAL